jgi:hypothetical protein
MCLPEHTLQGGKDCSRVELTMERIFLHGGTAEEGLFKHHSKNPRVLGQGKNTIMKQF